MDPQLGRGVDAGADPGEPAAAAEERIEVLHLGADPDPLVTGRIVVTTLDPANRDSQVASARAGDEEPALDRPGDLPEPGAEVVLGPPEPQ